MNQNAGQADALLHPSAECPDQGSFFFRETHQFQDIPDSVFAFFGRNAVAGAEKVKVLGDFHVLVDTKKIRHVADEVSDSIGLLNDRMPQDVSRS